MSSVCMDKHLCVTFPTWGVDVHNEKKVIQEAQLGKMGGIVGTESRGNTRSIHIPQFLKLTRLLIKYNKQTSLFGISYIEN